MASLLQVPVLKFAHTPRALPLPLCCSCCRENSRWIQLYWTYSSWPGFPPPLSFISFPVAPVSFLSIN